MYIINRALAKGVIISEKVHKKYEEIPFWCKSFNWTMQKIYDYIYITMSFYYFVKRKKIFFYKFF